MKFYKWLFLFVFFSGLSVFSQEKYTRHTVSKGETISEIAKQYNVNPKVIYELNPDAQNGIKFKTVLLIPNESESSNNVKVVFDSPNPSSENTHQVLPKETLYGIAKQYNIKIEDLYKINPELEKEGLKRDQIIKIPPSSSDNLASSAKTESPNEVKTNSISKNNVPKEEVVVSSQKEEKVEIATEGISHQVLPKQSLYSIAKKHKITIAELEKANPSLANPSLKAGQTIIVPLKMDTNTSSLADVKPSKSEKDSDSEQLKQSVVSSRNSVEEKQSESETIHEVLPRETLYSIAKLYRIKVSEVQKANPSIGKKALKTGQKIVIPVKEDTNSNLVLDKKEVKTEKDNTDSPQDVVDNNSTENEYTREVLPKETKYGIAKEYGITVAELERQNPNIVKKLIIGSVLKIRSSKVIESAVAKEEVVMKEEVVKTESTNTANSVRDTVFVDQLIQTAYENIGTRYRSGGVTKEGFDCSGLMCATFGTYDIKLPRSSIEMASYGTRINTEEAQKGDLIFFKTNGRRQINHVGMVIEVNDGEIKFIHSASHGGVMISSTKESYYEKNLAQINRVL